MQSKNPFGPVPPSTNPFDAPPERRIPQPMAGVMVQPAVAASAVVVQSSPVAVEIAPPVILPSPPKAPRALTFEAAERLLKDYTDRDRHQKVLNACNEFINQAEEARYFGLRAQAYWGLRKSELAMQDVERAINQGGPTADLLTTRGIIYREHLKDHNLAQTDFTNAIGLGAGAFTLRMRGQSYLECGQKILAVGDYRGAVMRDPENPGALLDAGNAFLITGMHDEAIHYLTHALEIRPGHRQTEALLREANEQQFGKTKSNAPADKSDVSTVKRLLDVRKMAVTDLDVYNGNIFLKSIIAGDQELVTYLLSKGVNTDAVDSNRNNAVHLAALNQQDALIPQLVKRIDCTTSNNQGDNPLELAVKNGFVNTTRVLLESGVSPQLPQKNKHILTIAAESGQVEVLALLVDMPFFESALQVDQGMGGLIHACIAARQPETLEYLLDRFPQAVEATYNGVPPLHQAVVTNNWALVDVLLAANASLEAIDPQKQTAMQIAASKHMTQVIASLKQAAADREFKQQHQNKLLNNFIDNIIARLHHENWPLKDKNLAKMRDLLTNTIRNHSAFFSALQNQKLDVALTTELLMTDLIARRKDIVTGANNMRSEAIKSAIQTGIMHWQVKFAPPVVESAAEAKEEKEDNEALLQRHIWLNNLTSFCSRFETQFDIAFGKFRAMADGELRSVPDEVDAAVAVGKAAAAFAPGVTLPGTHMKVSGSVIGVATGALLDMGLYIRERFRRAEAENMRNLFEAVPPSERTAIVLYTARSLAEKYKPQLIHLMTDAEGITRFADAAVARVIDYIVSSSKHQLASRPGIFKELGRWLTAWALGQEIPTELERQKGLFDIFVDGILKIQTRADLDKKRLRTISPLSDDWCAKGIFENTGVITPDGKRWAHPDVEIERYGYCFGTMADVQKRGLTDKDKKGNPWGPGRVWEKRLIEATPDMEATLHGIPHGVPTRASGVQASFYSKQGKAMEINNPSNKPKGPGQS